MRSHTEYPNLTDKPKACLLGIYNVHQLNDNNDLNIEAICILLFQNKGEFKRLEN